MKRIVDVNRVDSIKEEHVVIKKDKGKTTVSIDYEVRIPLWGNLDGVAKFSHFVEFPDQ
jgi:hypothetical protein